MLHYQLNSPLQRLSDPIFDKHKLNVYLKRDDLIHPEISGNKWRKLKYNLLEAQRRKKTTLVSFGGAYSNHIHALAHAGKMFNLNTVGIIRGEYDPNNPTLKQAEAAGMRLQFVSRLEYRDRHKTDYQNNIIQQYSNSMLIPEGGSNKYALEGIEELVKEIPVEKSNIIACPCGSGGTSAGILRTINSSQRILSIPVLKNAEYLKDEICTLANKNDQQLDFPTQFHQGGYGKINPKLLSFIDSFYKMHQVKLEPIYSGKMMMAIYQLIEEGYFKPNTSITIIHTGGLQGLSGLKQRGLIDNDFLNGL